MATDPPIRVTTDDLEALQKISAWIVQAYPTLARLATGDLKPPGVVSRDDYNAATDTIRELEEVINGGDHKVSSPRFAAAELEALAGRAHTMQHRVHVDDDWAKGYVAALAAVEHDARTTAAKLRGGPGDELPGPQGT